MALSFPVSVSKLEDLRRRMEALQVKESDWEETFFKASGPGGQKTNKTQTGVALFHPATGLRVRCQRERSQGINRFLVRRLMVEELEARAQRKTRHEVKAEKLRAIKERQGKVKPKSRSVHETMVDQFVVRSLPSPSPRP